MQFDAMVLCSLQHIPIYPKKEPSLHTFLRAILDESFVRYQTKPGRHDVRVHLLDVVVDLLLLDSSKTPTDPSRFASSKSFSNTASFGKR